jgi:hypothetical protein
LTELAFTYCSCASKVVGITQATVDIFLEEMYIESSDRAADDVSRAHVRQMASTLNEAAYSLPQE